MTIATHPDVDTLAAYGLGRLPAAERGAVENHVASCVECGEKLARVGGDSLVNLAKQAMVATLGPADATSPAHTQIQGAEMMSSLSGPRLVGGNVIPAALVDHPRYEIVGKIGAGGMGVVYKAEHRIMGRAVALKVLNTRMTAADGAVERFRREVRLASRLNHPNIVTAHDADEAGGLHFLVMEYVEGVSLHQLVERKGALAVPMACHLIRQAALGLQHAHEKGMIHRDIKPANLMVTKKGQVKILDFGLARIASGDGPDPDKGTAARMTSPELVVGTPDYLAPEQARNTQSIDIRADLYALGCSLYFLLTGKVPFGGSGAFEKMIAHVQDKPPCVSATRRDVPPAVIALVAKLMSKSPDDRYQTPAELAAALLPLAKGAENAGPVAGASGVRIATRPGSPAVPMAAPLAVIPTGDTVANRAVATPAVPTPSILRAEVVNDDFALTDDTREEPRSTRKRSRRRAKEAAARRRMLIATVAIAGFALSALGLGAFLLSQRNDGKDKPTEPVPVADKGQPKPKPKNAVPPPTKPTEKQPDPAPTPMPNPEPPKPLPEPEPPKPAARAPNRILFVLPPNELVLNDFFPVRDALAEKAGFEIHVAGVTMDPVKVAVDGFGLPIGGRPKNAPGGPDGPPKDGPMPPKGRPFPPKGDKGPPPVPVSMRIADAKPQDYAAVIFVGKWSRDYTGDGVAAKDAKRLIDGIMYLASDRGEKRVVGAICGGVMVLKENQRLSGHAVARSDNYDCTNLNTEDKPVVVSLPFVTAKGPEAADAFAFEIARQLGAINAP